MTTHMSDTEYATLTGEFLLNIGELNRQLSAFYLNSTLPPSLNGFADKRAAFTLQLNNDVLILSRQLHKALIADAMYIASLSYLKTDSTSLDAHYTVQ
jgi:hypothetical protein